MFAYHSGDQWSYLKQYVLLNEFLLLNCSVSGIKLSTKEDFFAYTDTLLILRNLGLVFLGALIAFFLEFSEFLLLASTSSLTLAIAGIFKVGTLQVFTWVFSPLFLWKSELVHLVTLSLLCPCNMYTSMQVCRRNIC